jgi:hypothetical protein
MTIVRPRALFFLLLSAGVVAGMAGAADFHVSPTGNDTNPGSSALPWRTIQHAAETVPAGSTVLIREGVYAEKVAIYVSGNAVDGPIVFKAYPGERPVIDGSGLPFDPVNSNSLISIYDQSYLRIEGLTLRNLRTATRDLVPIGILVENESSHIAIVNNVIHGIETRYNGLDGGDAHGIAVFGSAAAPLSHILISGNELYDLKLGSSEALVLNGNVTDFEVSDNVVRDCNNIGIDFIGFEGTGPTPALDQARDGICRDNLVFNIDSSFNPAYNGSFTAGGGDTSAGGIYVDGGTRLLIERNVVHHCNIGIELASEHAGRATSAITLRNNLIYQNQIGGIFMGGYDTLRGMTRECLILNNTLFENDTNQDGNGEIHLQFDVTDCVIRNNLVKTNSQGLLFGNPYTQNSGNDVDYQLFFAPSGAQEWQWKNVFYTTLSAYRSGSGNDANSLLAAPAFADAAAYDFRLASGSPARNAADPARAIAPGETDFHGAARLGESRIDHGAFEYRTTASGATLAVTGKGHPVGNGDDTPDAADGTDLGEVNWREGSLEAEFNITNTGTEIFRPSRFALESPGSGTFRFARLFASLPPGESRSVRVIFDPAAAGSVTTSLVIYGAGASGNTFRFSLRGTGVDPDQLPDQQAGLSPSSLLGNDLYNTTALGQTAALTMRKKRVVCAFRSENDGALADTLQVTGTAGNRLLRVSYFQIFGAGRGNVTSALLAGSESLSLDPGVGQAYECRLSKTSRAIGRKFRFLLSLTARSLTLTTSSDRAAVSLTGR